MGFWAEYQEVKCPSYHISEVHAIMFVRFLHYRVTFSSLFHMPFLGSKSINDAHIWESGKIKLYLLERMIIT